MACKNGKLILFIDQCSAHLKQIQLQNVMLVFLTLDTMSHLQQLDTGIIRNVKHHFKGLLVRCLLAKIECKDHNLHIRLLDALHSVAFAWDRVKGTTIQSCFRKCGFFITEVAMPTHVEEDHQDDPVIEMAATWHRRIHLWLCCCGQWPCNMWDENTSRNHRRSRTASLVERQRQQGWWPWQDSRGATDTSGNFARARSFEMHCVLRGY